MQPYVLPELRFDYSALEPHVSGRIMELHHSKHHAAYVSALNSTLEQLDEARARSDMTSIVGLEKTLAFNLSGHVMHSVFWENLSPDGGARPEGRLLRAVEEDFGSFDAMRTQLTAATVSVQGSGWGVLGYEPLGRRLLVEQVYDHHANVVQGLVPLVVFDAWEHAYYLQYENRRPDYVEALWEVVDWHSVGSRFADLGLA